MAFNHFTTIHGGFVRVCLLEEPLACRNGDTTLKKNKYNIRFMKMSSFKHGLKKVQVLHFFNLVRVELIQEEYVEYNRIRCVIKYILCYCVEQRNCGCQFEPATSLV